MNSGDNNLWNSGLGQLIFCAANFMDLQPIKDFKEFLESFNAKGVEYLVVGGYALAYHGVPRSTGDLDLWVNPSPENADRIIGALSEFGFGSLGLKTVDFLKEGHVVQLGLPPVRIDIMTSVSGVLWENAWGNRRAGYYGGIPIWFIGLSDFVANKKAVGRHRDLADIESLGDN